MSDLMCSMFDRVGECMLPEEQTGLDAVTFATNNTPSYDLSVDRLLPIPVNAIRSSLPILDNTFV